MKTLSAREYLGQLQELDTNINQDLERLDDMKINACSTGAIDYSAERVQTSPSGDSLCKAVTNYVAFNDEINAEIDRFVDEKHEIINQIQALQNPKHIDILYKHYVEFKRLEIVAVEMNFTYQYIVELHGTALKEFQLTHENLLNSNDEP